MVYLPEIRFSDRLVPENFSEQKLIAPFNLHIGQICHAEVFHNAGWYAIGHGASCPKLGWGDLSVTNILKIEDELVDGEAMFILPEQYSFWEFTIKIGMIGSMSSTRPEMMDPGKKWVAEYTMAVIMQKKLLVVRSDPRIPTGETFQCRHRDDKSLHLPAVAIHKEDVYHLLGISLPVKQT